MRFIIPVQTTRQLARSSLFSGLMGCLCLLLATLATAQTSAAEAANRLEFEDPFLQAVAAALRVYELDVVLSLNDRDLVRQRIRRPRFGRFPDLPSGSLPSSEEIGAWESEYTDAQIGGIAILWNSESDGLIDLEEYVQAWLAAPAEARIFVSFYKEDRVWADKIEAVAGAYDYHVQLFIGGEVLPAARLYATAAQRLAIDSRAARRYRTKVTELSYLGERVRRNSNSLFKDDGNNGNRGLARNEPAVFLKETLGDEFNQSTIREIVVPGGVALGETASLPISISALVYTEDALYLVDDSGERWQLPELESKTLKALFDFADRADAIHSDAVVDIDVGGRVRISSALRNTDAGYEIMHADTQPFDYVPNLPVTKSMMMDIGVDWFAAGANKSLEFETDYEIRFLSANNMRIAQTRVALQYEYESISGATTYQDSWGPYVSRLSDKLDYSGLGSSMAGVAKYAGWIGLFRKLREDDVPFVRGRYEFMKIDKTGRATPSHY